MSGDIWLTDKETALRLGIKLRTLQNWRANEPDRLPPASNLGRDGGRPLWRFKESDVDEFLRGRIVRQRRPKGETNPRERIVEERAEERAIKHSLKSE